MKQKKFEIEVKNGKLGKPKEKETDFWFQRERGKNQKKKKLSFPIF